MMDRIAEIALLGSKPEWAFVADPKNPNDPLTIANSVRSETSHLMRTYSEEVQTIEADGDLTPSGKERRIAALREKYANALDRLRDSITVVENARIAAIERAEKKIATEDRLTRMLLEIEVRRELQTASDGDPLQTRIQYIEALEEDDHLTMDAIENAPRTWRGRLDQPALEELKKRRIEKTDPRLGQEVQHLEQAVRDSTSTLEFASAEILGRFDQVRALAPLAG